MLPGDKRAISKPCGGWRHNVVATGGISFYPAPSLSEAIRRTFERRKTSLPTESHPTALTPEFYDHATKQKQWEAFVPKNKHYIAPVTLRQVTDCIRDFVIPVLPCSVSENAPDLKWKPGGPWLQV
jgi:hypothetical protein